MISRRGLLAGAMTLSFSSVAIASSGCARRSERDALRIGAMANVTHAPLLAAWGSGRLERALGPVDVRLFRAGPRVVEALLGDAIDVGTCGPAPIVFHHVRERAVGREGALAILSGCASGGASFVLARGLTPTRDDLRKKRIAIVQLGSTQDVALRTFLQDIGLADAEHGGDVTLDVLSHATIAAEMKRGGVHGSWAPEPLATRLVAEANATRAIDERDRWPNRAFASAVLVARRDAIGARTALLAEVLANEIERAARDPDELSRASYAALVRATGKTVPQAVHREAIRYVDFTRDPLPQTIERFAEGAARVGLLPRATLDGLFA